MAPHMRQSRDLDLEGSFDFSCSYSAADYVPPSLENSPANSPTNSPPSTPRGPSTTVNRRFNCAMDYFDPPTPPSPNSRSYQYPVAPPNTPCGSIRSARSVDFSTMEPEDATSNGHINAVEGNSIQEDTVQYNHNESHLSVYHAPASPDMSVVPVARMDSSAPSEPTWVTWPFPSRVKMSRSFALPPPSNPLVRRPFFGPPVRACRCCNIYCSAKSLSDELATESLVVGPQLQVIRTKLYTLISSMTMTVDIGSIKLLESMQVFLNLASVIVDEFDEVVSKFKVRWEHRITPLPEPAPPRYFNEAGDDFDDDILSIFPAMTFLGDSVIDGDVFCKVWKHCESRFRKFEVVDAADVLLANDFVQRIFKNFVELTKRLRKGNYMRARLAVVKAKLAQEKIERKDVRIEKIIRRIRRIDEDETIGDDTCMVAGDDAMKMEIRVNQLAADAEAEEMRVRWNRRQNELANRQW